MVVGGVERWCRSVVYYRWFMSCCVLGVWDSFSFCCCLFVISSEWGDYSLGLCDTLLLLFVLFFLCSRFCCDSGFVFPLSGGYFFIELVLRSVFFVICGLLRMRIVFSSCSFWPCRLFGIIVHLLFSHRMYMIWNLAEISVDVCSGHLLQNGICLLQALFFSVDMDGFLNNVSHWIGDFFWTNQTAVYWDWVCLFVEVVM